MNKKKIIIIILLVLVILTGCAGQKSESEQQTVEAKPINVLDIQEQSLNITLDYIGVVQAKETKKVSFETAGKIEKIYVTKGQRVEKGDILAELNTEDLQYALDSAKIQLEIAEKQYEKASNGATEEEINQVEVIVKKAEEAYKYSLDNFESIKALYEAGAISKDTFDNAQLDLKIKELDLELAKENEKQVKAGARQEDKDILAQQYELAKVNYTQKQAMLTDAKLIADMKGYVVDVLFKEGDLISQGIPVFIIQDDEQVVSLGVIGEDLDDIEIGMKALISTEDHETTGEITNIMKVPDTQSRTYEVEIDIPEKNLKIGEIVDVSIIIGQEQGIWIPINSIMKDDFDYVYVLKDDVAIQRKINILGADSDQIKVEGLYANEKLIIEGIKDLNNGDRVKVADEGGA